MEQNIESKKNAFLDFLKFFLPLVALALLLRFFVFQPYIVSGESMQPNYRNGEYLIVQKISKISNSFKRGDVVVFKNPENIREDFLKRIIGLPGERVEVKQNQIYVYNNEYSGGFLIQEKYLNDSLTKTQKVNQNYYLGDDEFFVMGDNRTNSIDSRSFGPLNKKYIVGKLWLQAEGFLNFDLFKSPSY